MTDHESPAPVERPDSVTASPKRDIVLRLRNCVYTDGVHGSLMQEAADEIEHLRSLVFSLAGAVSHDGLDFASIKHNAKNIRTVEFKDDADRELERQMNDIG